MHRTLGDNQIHDARPPHATDILEVASPPGTFAGQYSVANLAPYIVLWLQSDDRLESTLMREERGRPAVTSSIAMHKAPL